MQAHRCLPLVQLCSLYTRKFNFGQSIWDKKCGAIGNILGNTLGTICKLDWNTVRTHCEQKKLKKFPSPSPNPKKKKKKGLLECMLSLLIGCKKFLFKKPLCHNFWLGLIPFPNRVGTRYLLQMDLFMLNVRCDDGTLAWHLSMAPYT